MKERLQLRCFPLYPQHLDWRKALEPVAAGATAAAQNCTSATGQSSTGHVVRVQSSTTSSVPLVLQTLAEVLTHKPPLLNSSEHERGPPCSPAAAGISKKRARRTGRATESCIQEYAALKKVSSAGSESSADTLTKVAQAMGCNLHWDNLSFWTFHPHTHFMQLQECSPTAMVKHYLGSLHDFMELWTDVIQSEARPASADLRLIQPGRLRPDLKDCVLDLTRVPAVAALGLLGDVLSGGGKVWSCEESAVIPPLELYLDMVEMNKRLPTEERKPMVKYMLYRALRKVPQRPLYHGHPPRCHSCCQQDGRKHLVRPAEEQFELYSTDTSDYVLPAQTSSLCSNCMQFTSGPAFEPRSSSSDEDAVMPSDEDSDLVRQYMYRLFQGSSKEERNRLQDMLYLGSKYWEALHRDFRLKRQPFVKTFEVLQWVKSSPAVVELQSLGIHLVGEEGVREDSGDRMSTAEGMNQWTAMLPNSSVDWSTVQWSVDHIVPVKHEGADHWSNYCLMPRRVNSAFGKHAMAKGGVSKNLLMGRKAYEAAIAFHRRWTSVFLAPAAASPAAAPTFLAPAASPPAAAPVYPAAPTLPPAAALAASPAAPTLPPAALGSCQQPGSHRLNHADPGRVLKHQTSHQRYAAADVQAGIVIEEMSLSHLQGELVVASPSCSDALLSHVDMSLESLTLQDSHSMACSNTSATAATARVYIGSMAALCDMNHETVCDAINVSGGSNILMSGGCTSFFMKSVANESAGSSELIGCQFMGQLADSPRTGRIAVPVDGYEMYESRCVDGYEMYEPRCVDGYEMHEPKCNGQALPLSQLELMEGTEDDTIVKVVGESNILIRAEFRRKAGPADLNQGILNPRNHAAVSSSTVLSKQSSYFGYEAMDTPSQCAANPFEKFKMRGVVAFQ
ncbi:hypothetical protein CEUSTIGMA_g6476.t1 [Chlamydomonas eustigma]|uniref:Uncharacterized protein n=1 Tax=Chlamydomonas eustigma TaxID=1157962 RepID=A0A250X7K8_9CHLO|nr:hypothetical protein CEUSTIGMA_g6476.t1 [Chlamydomonas eustigma]|eukprot:GAX79036.1 hypothetical protein CEUSTIGMA_g6476.t1 [Chlamydomonas eustigma]